VKRETYPEKYGTDSDAKKKTDENRSIKVRGMEIISYFLGGAAAISLAIAGLHGSPNRWVTIFFVWLGGILTVTAGCCLWLSAEWKKAAKTPEDRFAVMASVTPTPTTTFPPTTSPAESKPAPSVTPAEVSQAASPPKPTPFLSPSSSETNLTPTQIFDKIEAANALFRDDVRRAFAGLSVDWTLSFVSASPRGDSMQMFLRDNFRLVLCKVPLKGNERFPLMEGTDRFRVRGKIEEVEILTINLKDVSIEQVH
jgi:hypothetical protein